MKEKTIIISILFFTAICIIFSLFAPYVFTQTGLIDFTNTGSIGDTINGLMGPFIALAGIMITFLAFFIQFRANEMQKKELAKQEKRIEEQENEKKKSDFETKLITLLSYHRENVRDIEINYGDKPYKGQCAIELFVAIIDNIKTTTAKKFAKDALDTYGRKNMTISVYLFFNFGNKIFDSKDLQAKYPVYLNDSILKLLPPCLPVETYVNGFGNIISRYFRQLYQIIKYIDSNSLLSDEEKYSYAKMVRSSLTNAEQILLFYNAMSPLGLPWVNERLIVKYKLIKNIPLHTIKEYKPSSWFIEEFKIPKEELIKHFETYEQTQNIC